MRQHKKEAAGTTKEMETLKGCRDPAPDREPSPLL
jgi:hypothetical protein